MGSRMSRTQSVHEEESDGRDKAGTCLNARHVSMQRLQLGWRLLHMTHFSGVGARVKEDWPGGAPWDGGHRALEEKAEGSIWRTGS